MLAASSVAVWAAAPGRWTPTGSMATARINPTETLLLNGKVLVAGGWNTTIFASAELYDPHTGKWSATGSMMSRRAGHTATRLLNGKVLVAGGTDNPPDRSAELYDPATGT